ncbi:hypothetical protein SSTU70S_02863 [Stutzerimonas stutzeri]
MKLSTYLTFDGQAREAFTFYQQVLGGTLEMMTFAQAPEAEQFPAEHRERIMHVCLTLDGYRLMASDTIPGMDCGSGSYEGIKGCSISLHPDSVPRASVCSPGRVYRRPGRHADGKDLLGRTLRHVHRSLRRVLDGQLRTPLRPTCR